MSSSSVDKQVDDAAENIATSLIASWIANTKCFPALHGEISSLKKTILDEEHWHLIIRKIYERHPDLAHEVAYKIFNTHYFETSPLDNWVLNTCFIVFLDGVIHFSTGISLIYSVGEKFVAHEWKILWLDFLFAYLAFGLHMLAFATGFLAVFHYFGFFKSRVKGHFYRELHFSKTKKERTEPKF